MTKQAKSGRNVENRSAQTVAVKIREIMDGMEMVDDQTTVYYDTKTGQLILDCDASYGLNEVSSEELANNKRYLQLPDRFEINEYHMVEAFIADQSEENANRLFRAIQGRGAFRRFKDLIDELGLSEAWYEFRENCYRDRAVRWCLGNDLKYEG